MPARLLIVLLMLILAAPALAAKKQSKSEPPPIEGVPPADAQWTIYCQAIAGPDHVQRANMIKAELLRATGLKDWYVIHSDTESVIYYGFYRSISDPKDKKESERAQAELAKMTQLADQHGNRIFAQCLFVQVTAPDPNAPPEWDLRNANGFWSLEIAVYKDSPERKQAAVDAVREARKQGIEAYYYHGPTASSVCIGAWPREAVAEQDQAVGEAANDAEQDILVLPQPLDIRGGVEVRNREGKRVRALAPRIEPVDASLLAMIARYPTHAVNGNVMITRGKDPAGTITEVPDPSLLVKIPHDAPSILRPGTAAAPPPSLLQPTSPSQVPGAGKLRSVGQ